MSICSFVHFVGMNSGNPMSLGVQGKKVKEALQNKTDGPYTLRQELMLCGTILLQGAAVGFLQAGPPASDSAAASLAPAENAAELAAAFNNPDISAGYAAPFFTNLTSEGCFGCPPMYIGLETGLH